MQDGVPPHWGTMYAARVAEQADAAGMDGAHLAQSALTPCDFFMSGTDPWGAAGASSPSPMGTGAPTQKAQGDKTYARKGKFAPLS